MSPVAFARQGSNPERLMKKEHYSVVIQWSDEDEAYVATLPEWGGCHTHGSTYEEAAKNAPEVLASLIEGEQDAGRLPPAPHKFIYPGPSGFTYEFAPSRPALNGVKNGLKKAAGNSASRAKSLRRTPA
jgi:predicted RNase H-like HicB family nuclease